MIRVRAEVGRSIRNVMGNENMKVPLSRQKKNSCGLTALHMVLKYFGKDVSENQIIRSVGGIKKYGVRTVRLAEFAKRFGFKVECLSYNKRLAGSKAKIKKPNMKDILKFLKKGIPVILAVRSSLLYGEKPSEMGHFIVVTGYKNGIFWYNDPHDGKRHKIAEEDLLFAWFNNVLDSSAYLLTVWPLKSRESVRFR